MTFKPMILNAYQALRQNLRRSILTMLGIIIGVASVITILSLGEGFQSYTVKNLTQSDSKSVSVEIDFNPSHDNPSNLNFFNEVDLHLVESVKGVTQANYNRQSDLTSMQDFQFRTGRYTKTIKFEKSSQGRIIYGRNFSRADNDSLNKVAVISESTAKEISNDPKRVLGYGIALGGEFYNVIGISESNQASGLFSEDSDIEIPQKTYTYYKSQSDTISSIKLSVQKGYKPSAIANTVVKKLTQSGSMASQGTYSTLDMSSLLDGISKILSTLTFFISGIAGISLFIAGVGVMNMMYTSVSERTQEIGVRRAMGGKRRDIRRQFLAEGLLLTLSSGVIGYLIGFLVALLISQFLPFRVSPTFATIGVAVGITTLLGLVFSVAPANAAAKKDLVEILR